MPSASEPGAAGVLDLTQEGRDRHSRGIDRAFAGLRQSRAFCLQGRAAGYPTGPDQHIPGGEQ